MKRRYELRDDQWEHLKPFMPPERKPQGGRPAKDNRHMLNVMLWVVRSGAPWRDLPDYYGPWQSVYTRFRRWEKAGLFDHMLECLSADPDEESVMIDASIIAATLGHKNVITTLDTYSHVIDELEQRDSELTDLALNDLYSLRKIGAK